MFVTGSTGSFVAGGVVYFVFGNAVNLVVFDNSGSEGTDDLASEVAVYFVAACLEHSAEIVFDGHHPSIPLYFTNGAIQSPFTFLCLWCCSGTGGCSLLDLWVYLYRGFEVTVGGIGQSFLN